MVVYPIFLQNDYCSYHYNYLTTQLLDGLTRSVTDKIGNSLTSFSKWTDGISALWTIETQTAMPQKSEFFFPDFLSGQNPG